MARPRSHNRAVSSRSRVPASTVTRAEPSSLRTTDSMPRSESRPIWTPLVTAIGVKEWPAPTHRTVRDRSTAPASTARSSSTDLGSERFAGKAC